MTGFELDYSTFPAVAGQLDTARAALEEHTTTVANTVAGGNPWGGDKQGSAFGEIYADVLGHVVDVMATHGQLLDYASRALAEWHETSRGTDEDLSSMFDRLGGGG